MVQSTGNQQWKKARGKLGPMAPLIGCWRAEAESAMGPVSCVRDYRRFGDGYVRLEAEWYFRPPPGNSKSAKQKKNAEPPKPYCEVCLFGPDKDGTLSFWSYTNDGKKSIGKLADGTDIHPQAVCFEAKMDAGLARQVFWPSGDGGMLWAVESRTKKGWSRMAHHHYRPV